ncbi:HNH endonuclease [Robertmurraya korlensis]|uniref:HNH endonuclease n=1 Tax=Robertmurraya korlensis TaxID=519977 RepID=UPI00203AC8AC|nr:HNH endonuclease [Robertmurraya korlensis]MCM3599381.1 HNH endonuclease [Robertmurraya korlensis]
MLRSCKYCGSIHDRSYQCPYKPVRKKEATYIDKFRRLRVWTNKSKEIRERDRHLCQMCIREFPARYTFTNIEVHHIVPIIEDWSKRLNNDYLISLCAPHHKLAEDGQIDRQTLIDIAKKQEENNKI